MTTNFTMFKADGNQGFVKADKGDPIAMIQYSNKTGRYKLDLNTGEIKYEKLDAIGNLVTGTEKTLELPKLLLNKLNNTFALKTDLDTYTKTDGSNMTEDIQNKLMSHHITQVFDFLSSLETEYNAMHG